MNKVKVWEEKIAIPTYPLVEETPHPSFSLDNCGEIYPYTQFMVQDEKIEEHDYHAINMENDYLKVIILPELGGHIYSAYDKVKKMEMFYRNKVIKPARILLRGAWICGGVEFNFPQGHTVTTISLIDYSFRENPDNSVSVFVGNQERIYGMRWQVKITLYSEANYVETEITTLNSSDIEQYYYVWSNAAVEATEDLRLIFPAKYVFYSNIGLETYPIDSQGTDHSWYKTNEFANDSFAVKSKEDFFGVYWQNSNFGLVHIGDRLFCPGKKFFSWGYSPQGKRWMENLSDDGIPYVEVQSGTGYTQSDYSLLLPQQESTWKEYWYPVAEIGGFVHASLEGALNLKTGQDSIEWWFYAVRILAKYRLCVFSKETLLEEFSIDLNPGDIITRKMNYSGRKEALRFKLINEAGLTCFSYSPGEDWDNRDNLFYSEVKCSPRERKDAYGLFLKGVYEDRRLRNNLEKAMEYFELSLKENPHFAPAWIQLGLSQLKQGLFTEAEGSFERALKINPLSKKGYYYLGLCKKFQGKYSEAIVQLEKTLGDKNYEAAALKLLGELSYAAHQYRKTMTYFEAACQKFPDNPNIIARLNFARRKMGKIDASLLQRASQNFPLNYMLQSELFFSGIGGNISLKDRESYLELATEYHRLGAWDEAIGIIEEAKKKVGLNLLLKLHLAYYLEKRSKEGEEILKDIQMKDVDLSFPKKTETFVALRELSKYKNKFVYYHLGLLYYDYGQKRFSLQNLEEAVSSGLEYGLCYRMIGLILKEMGAPREKYLAAYEKAHQVSPQDPVITMELSRLYRQLNMPEKREELWVVYPLFKKAPNLLNLGRLVYYVDTEQYDNAQELIDKQNYLICEAEVTPVVYFFYLQVQRAHLAHKQGNDGLAQKILDKAFTPPYNWGYAKGEYHLESWLSYELGKLAENQGQNEEAEQYYRKAVNSRYTGITIDYYYRYLAGVRLKLPGAKELLEEFLKKAGHGANKTDCAHLYHYHLALGWRDFKDYSKSKKHLQETLNSCPAFSPAHRLQKELTRE